MLNPNLSRSVVVSLLSGIICSSAVNFIIPFSFTTEVLAQTTVNPRKAEDVDRLLTEGIKQYKSSQYSDALKSWENALKISREIGYRVGESHSLNNIGLFYGQLGEYQKALEYYQQSLNIAKEIHDRAGISQSLGNMGLIYASLGEYPKALEYHQQSLNIAKEMHDRVSESKSLNNLGIVYEYLGEYRKALEYYQQSLTIKKEIRDRYSESQSLHNIGNVYTRVGEYQKALDYYQQSLTIKKEIRDRYGESQSLNNLGNVYDNLGQYEKALEYYQQSLIIAKEIHDRAGESKSLNNIGLIYDTLGEYQTALEYYQQSLTITKEIRDRVGVSQSLHNIGLLHDRVGKYQEALEYYQQSLTITQEIRDRAGESQSLNNIGLVYNSLGEYQKALEYYQKSLTITKEIHDHAGQGISLGNIGKTYADLKNYLESEKYLLASLDVLDSLRSGLKDQDKVSIFETQISSYYALQSVLVAQNKTEQALEVSERSRARAFIELLSSRLGNTSIKPPTLAQIKDIAKKENATLVEYSIIGNKLLIWVIEARGKITLRQVDLKSQNLAQIAEKGRVAAALGRARSSELENRKISELVRGTREDVSTSSKPSQPTIRNLQQLYQLLIQPIDDLLPKNPDAHVIFIPHQSLFLVPFAALQDAQGKYLVEKHTLLTATSIQQLELSHQLLLKNQPTNPPNSLVVGIPRKSVILGNPSPMPKVIYRDGTSEQLDTLKGAEEEAKTIAKILKIEPLIGNQATKTKILAQMSDAKIIHLATHGLLNDLGTGIPGVLAFAPSGKDNGLLTSSEIFDLKLNASLVVLSACNTGRGKLTGDGVIGLSRAFLSAGVPSIIVSLWAVNDASTAFLMTQFYHHWQEEKMDKAQALRQAMLSTIKQYPKPGNWAAFTLIGEIQ